MLLNPQPSSEYYQILRAKTLKPDQLPHNPIKLVSLLLYGFIPHSPCERSAESSDLFSTMDHWSPKSLQEQTYGSKANAIKQNQTMAFSFPRKQQSNHCPVIALCALFDGKLLEAHMLVAYHLKSLQCWLPQSSFKQQDQVGNCLYTITTDTISPIHVRATEPHQRNVRIYYS